MATTDRQDHRRKVPPYPSSLDDRTGPVASLSATYFRVNLGVQF